MTRQGAEASRCSGEQTKTMLLEQVESGAVSVLTPSRGQPRFIAGA
jgi:hypothetical protein